MDMKQSSRLADATSLALVVGTFGLTAAVYRSLPERIPTHFDLRGVPNGWMSRPLGAWLLPVLVLAVAALLRFGAVLLPSAWRMRLEKSPTAWIVVVLIGLFCAMQCVILYAALARPLTVGTWLSAILGIFWIALGLLLSRVRRNPWIGVRTPWTLSSDENWARTHRFAGFSFIVGGIVALFCTVASLPALAVAAIVLSALLPAVQSYRFARHEKEA
jgi:uncharacterized membrane protein